MPKLSILLLIPSIALLAACNQEPAPNVTLPAPDTSPPSVTLKATPGALSTSGTVALAATASDNVAVKTVSFYRGETLISEDSTAPYEAMDTVTVTNGGKMTYRAVAMDVAGNKGEGTAEVTTSLKAITGTLLDGFPKQDSNGQFTFEYKAWTGGASTLDVTSWVPSPDSPMGIDQVVLFSGAVSANGDFVANLPDLTLAQTAPLFRPSNCDDNLTISDPMVRVGNASLEVKANTDKSGPINPFNLVSYDGTTLVSETGVLVYVDRLVTVKGSFTCGMYTQNYDTTLQQGWNHVYLREEEVRSSTTVSDTATYSTVKSVPNNWVYRNAPSTTSLSQQSVRHQRSFLFQR